MVIMEHVGDDDTNWMWNNPQRLRETSGEIGDLRKNQDHTDHSIVKIS